VYAVGCMDNGRGKIICSIYQNGGAILNKRGQARCGSGQCVVDGNGRTQCSNLQGSGASIKS